MNKALGGTRPRGGLARQLKRWHVVVVALAVVLLVALLLLGGRKKAPPTPPPTYHFPPYPPAYPGPPPMPVVQRAVPGVDNVRVEFITVGTKVNNMMCAHWASSVLSGISTTTAGYGKRDYSHRDKLILLNRTVNLKQMRDWDVLIYMDQDTMFTGADIQPYIDDFIRRSPAHPDDINVRDIRRGVMAAPLRLSTDPVCWAPQSLKWLPECEAHFKQFDDAMNKFSATHDFDYLWEANVSSMNARTNDLYVNSGFYMARVWAFRELLVGQTRFTPEFPHRGIRHDCDQSIYIALHMDLRWTELRLGLLEPDAKPASTPAVSQFGLHYGLIDVWRVQPPATLVHVHGVPANRVDATQYGLQYTTSMPEEWVRPAAIERTVTGILHGLPSAPQSLVRSVPPAHATSSTSTANRELRVAPSLLGITPRLVDQTAQGVFPSQFAAVIHFADNPKDPRVQMYLPFLGWYISMDLEPGARARAVGILRAAMVPVADYQTDKLTTVRLGDQCRSWIDTFVVDGARSY